MITKKLLTTLSLLFIAIFTTVYAQTKTITIVQNGGSKSITIDSLNTITEEVTTIVLNNINMDSIINSRVEDVDKVIKVITIVSDTLQNSVKTYTYAINSDDTEFEVVSAGAGVKKITDNDMNVVVNIDTLEGGEIVKKITITSSSDIPDTDYTGERIMVMSAGDEAEVAHHGNYVTVMKDGDNNEGMVWHTKSHSSHKKTLNSVAVSDLHLLKKAGFSANTLTSEPLELKTLNVNVEREKTSDAVILNLSLDITMPENDKATVTLIDKNGTKKEEKSFKDSDKINVEFEMNKESAPYYIVVLQDKKVWTKKIVF
jgi:hypothetical protein